MKEVKLMKIYVIRHGETEQGKNRIIANLNEPLNENGIKQAINVGKELKKLNFNKIYCSPIERAKYTLELFDLDKNSYVVQFISGNLNKFYYWEVKQIMVISLSVFFVKKDIEV